MKEEVNQVCDECGIAANRFTCLQKYGAEPKKLKFDVSTYSMGKCDVCWEIKPVTEPRDFFYPDFSFLIKE